MGSKMADSQVPQGSTPSSPLKGREGMPFPTSHSGSIGNGATDTLGSTGMRTGMPSAEGAGMEHFTPVSADPSMPLAAAAVSSMPTSEGVTQSRSPSPTSMVSARSSGLALPTQGTAGGEGGMGGQGPTVLAAGHVGSGSVGTGAGLYKDSLPAALATSPPVSATASAGRIGAMQDTATPGAASEIVPSRLEKVLEGREPASEPIQPMGDGRAQNAPQHAAPQGGSPATVPPLALGAMAGGGGATPAAMGAPVSATVTPRTPGGSRRPATHSEKADKHAQRAQIAKVRGDWPGFIKASVTSAGHRIAAQLKRERAPLSGRRGSALSAVQEREQLTAGGQPGAQSAGLQTREPTQQLQMPAGQQEPNSGNLQAPGSTLQAPAPALAAPTAATSAQVLQATTVNPMHKQQGVPAV